ncbi:MAG: Gfo/Idh/MocA family oxidoreductase [archaeon]
MDQLKGKKFAIIGCGGYIAPRHLDAIKDTGNILIAALDPNDSVGLLDRYNRKAAFFTSPERFDRYLDNLKREGQGIDYLSICSPNHLHDAHIRMALRNGANAICEKPLVLTAKNLDGLKQVEAETGKKINTILQLRLHPSIIELKKKVEQGNSPKHNVQLHYVTSRGEWYDYSWKGREEYSGGIATNIGIHLFDMLMHVFGKVNSFDVTYVGSRKIGGSLDLEKAFVSWFLSIDERDLPVHSNGSTYRSIKIDGEEFEFSDGFTDLHKKAYEEILAGRGFGIEDARPSIELVNDLRVLINKSKNVKTDL